MVSLLESRLEHDKKMGILFSEASFSPHHHIGRLRLDVGKIWLWDWVFAGLCAALARMPAKYVYGICVFEDLCFSLSHTQVVLVFFYNFKKDLGSS